MIANAVVELASTVGLIASADDGGGASPWLLVLGPAGGGGVYYFAWRYCRNTHRSHDFENETRIEAQPITGDEHKVRTITGTTKSGIDGDNHSDHRRRVQRVD